MRTSTLQYTEKKKKKNSVIVGIYLAKQTDVKRVTSQLKTHRD